MTRTLTPISLSMSVFLAGPLLAPRPVLAGPEEDLYRAYYLHHQVGDLEKARDLYNKAADSKKLDPELASRARLESRRCLEDLRSQNLAALMPPDPLAYVELGSPGEHLTRLLEQLGLVRDDAWQLPENVKQHMARIAVSPALLSQLSGFRGAAVAVTGFDPVKQQPSLVAVIHPGSDNVIRGLLETAIPAAGEPVNPIRGTRVFKIEDAYVALTPRLVIASQMRTEIDNALKRLMEDGTASLADNEEFAALQGPRDGRLLFACFNAKQVMPLVSTILQGAGQSSQEFAIASAVLDLDSLRWIALRAGVAEDGIAKTLIVRFDEDQNNLAYNFLRTPPLTGSALKCVPAGAVGFIAVALNEPLDNDPKRKSDKAETIRRITGLDIGREFFANIEEKAVFVMPPGEPDKMQMIEDGVPMPDVGLAFTVRDPAASTALWSQLLALPTFATGRPTPEGKPVRIAETEATLYEWPEGIRAYHATVDRHVLVALTERAMYHAIRAARGGDSVLEDAAFKASLARMSKSSSKAVFVHAGRAMEMAKAYAGDDMAEAEPFIPLFDRMVACFMTDESNSEFKMTMALTGIPDISGVIEQLVAAHMGGHGHSRGNLAKAPSARAGESARRAPDAARPTPPGGPKATAERRIEPPETGKAPDSPAPPPAPPGPPAPAASAALIIPPHPGSPAGPAGEHNIDARDGYPVVMPRVR